jgi:hypothetical protein
MKNETKPTEPRKLEKPAREAKEMDREELVTYANEGGGVVNAPVFVS